MRATFLAASALALAPLLGSVAATAQAATQEPPQHRVAAAAPTATALTPDSGGNNGTG